jgi:hypothetical protein
MQLFQFNAHHKKRLEEMIVCANIVRYQNNCDTATVQSHAC